MGRKPQYVNSYYKTLSDMGRKAKEIRTIQEICNTILANTCYHEKEMESQIAVAEKRGKITEEERDVICDAWTYRNKIGKELIHDLKVFMKENRGRDHGNEKDV